MSNILYRINISHKSVPPCYLFFCALCVDTDHCRDCSLAELGATGLGSCVFLVELGPLDWNHTFSWFLVLLYIYIYIYILYYIILCDLCDIFIIVLFLGYYILILIIYYILYILLPPVPNVRASRKKNAS